MEQVEGEEQEFVKVDATPSTKLDREGKQRIGQELEFSMSSGDTRAWRLLLEEGSRQGIEEGGGIN